MIKNLTLKEFLHKIIKIYNDFRKKENLVTKTYNKIETIIKDGLLNQKINILVDV